MDTLTAIGSKAIEFINDNIDNHVDADGKAFVPYSFNYWFYKKKNYRKNYKGKKLRSKAGKKKWQTFLNVARGEWSRVNDRVDLTYTGETLAALDVISTNNSEIKIGFRNQEAAQKAAYHNVSGAGKGRVLRKFLGLQPNQVEDLEIYASGLINNDKIFLIGLMKELGLELT